MSSPLARIPYSGAKLTGVSPGSETGDVLTWEQLFGAAGFLPLAGGTMTGSIVLPSNVLALQFEGPPTGIAGDGTGDMGFFANGTQPLILTTNLVLINTGAQIAIQDGSAGAPALAFFGDLTTGIFRDRGDLKFSFGGTPEFGLTGGFVMFLNATVTPGISTGTLGNATSGGDPADWLRVSVNGQIRAIPCWGVE